MDGLRSVGPQRSELCEGPERLLWCRPAPDVGKAAGRVGAIAHGPRAVHRGSGGGTTFRHPDSCASSSRARRSTCARASTGWCSSGPGASVSVGLGSVGPERARRRAFGTEGPVALQGPPWTAQGQVAKQPTGPNGERLWAGLAVRCELVVPAVYPRGRGSRTSRGRAQGGLRRQGRPGWPGPLRGWRHRLQPRGGSRSAAAVQGSPLRAWRGMQTAMVSGSRIREIRGC